MDPLVTTLGRVGLSVDGADVPLRGRRERSVLAVLVASGGRTVSADALLEAVWGQRVTGSSLSSLHVAISRLRTFLEPVREHCGAEQLLITRGAGYALLLPAGRADTGSFTDLVNAARVEAAGLESDNAPAERFTHLVELCDRALSLWAGAPFGDAADCDTLRAEAGRLESLRLQAWELRARGWLALGRHGLLRAETEALTLAHPLHEPFWTLLARSLYRTGDQARALATLRRYRQVLRTELDVDPGPALSRLEAGIVAHSPVSAAVPDEPDDSGRLVGRADELAKMSAVFDRMVQGRGETILISGEPGIGKTRLVNEFLAVTGSRATVLRGQSHEAGVSPAYWPWIPAVRALAGPVPPASIRHLVSPTGEHEDGDADADGDALSLRMFDAVTRLLVRAAGEHPLIIVLEDVQWADSASLRLLSYAAEMLAGSRVLLVVTVRESPNRPEELVACLGALGRLSVNRSVLGGLSRSQVGELAGALMPMPVDDELSAVLWDRTDGNPFFVIELVRLLVVEGHLDAEGARRIRVPYGVKDVLQLRVAHLPAAVVDVLRTAAVAGREFDLDIVATVTGIDSDEVLDRLDEAGPWVLGEGSTAGRYRFEHALVRETMIASLSRTRQARLHAAVAVALEPSLSADPDLVTAVAHHFVLGAAVRPELAERAVGHAVAAARFAEQRGTQDEALRHWQQALDTESTVPSKDPRRRYQVLLGVGRARRRRGQLAASREALEEAVALGRELGDMALVAGAAISFRGAGDWRWKEAGRGDPALLPLLEECAAARTPGSTQALVLACLSMELTAARRSAEADEAGRRAVLIAREMDDTALLTDVVSMRTLALWGRPGAASECLALVDEVLARSPTPEQEFIVRFGAVHAFLQLGATGEADRQISRFVQLARQMRYTSADVSIAWWRHQRAVASGDLTAARSRTREAIDLHVRHQPPQALDAMGMAELRAAEPGSPVPEKFVEVARRIRHPGARAYVSHLLLEAGRLPDALELLGDPAPDGTWDNASTYSDCLRVDVLAAAGPSTALDQAYARIKDWGHEFACHGPADNIGSIDYFVGRALEGQGRLPEAREAYARALEANRTAGIVPWARRSAERLHTLPAAVIPG